MANPNITCVSFRPFRKNTLRGFATIRFDEPPLEIREVHVHEQGDKCWALFPARPRLTADGELLRDRTSRIVHESLITVSDGEARAELSRAIVDAVKKVALTAFEPALELAP